MYYYYYYYSSTVVGKLLYKVTALLYFCYWLKKKLATFNPYQFFPVTVLLQLLVTAILNVSKSLPVTKKVTSYAVEPLTRYFYRFKKNMVKGLFLYTSSDVVTIPEEMYKIHVEKHNWMLSRKSNKVTFLGRHLTSYLVLVICYRYLILIAMVPVQLLVNYCYLKCNKIVFSQ
jgi:hypothetical protein